MSLDYDDFVVGGGMMSLIPENNHIPFRWYKHTAEFKQKQMYKSQLDSRNPSGTTVKRWQFQGGTCVEMRGTRSWFGQCPCGCWIYTRRDVSSPEFRGGDSGPKGRMPKYCTGCRVRRREESLQRRSATKRKADRERIADKRVTEREQAEIDAWVDSRRAAEAAADAADDARWAQEDREAAARHQQRSGVRSPYN